MPDVEHDADKIARDTMWNISLAMRRWAAAGYPLNDYVTLTLNQESIDALVAHQRKMGFHKGKRGPAKIYGLYFTADNAIPLGAAVVRLEISSHA